ncbi:MAG: universal stress protein, partial [Bacteroidia bacterium]|nr:universal stress protein [Bacteroidia bacterium]
MIKFKHSTVLIPVDFSETSLLAIKHGAFFAQLTKANLHLLHIINSNFGAQNMFLPKVAIEDFSDIESKAMAKLGELAAGIQADYGVKANCIVRLGSASTAITEVANEVDASLIVMGTHGYSPIQELVIGSTALKVFTKSPCPTMAMNNHATHVGYRKIILPMDNTANSKQKVNYAIEFAKKFSATLQVVALMQEGNESDGPAFNVVLKQISDRAAEQGVTVHAEILKSVVNSARSTIKYCEENGGDLIVIMTDQDAELSGFFLGPYSQQIIHL